MAVAASPSNENIYLTFNFTRLFVVSNLLNEEKRFVEIICNGRKEKKTKEVCEIVIWGAGTIQERERLKQTQKPNSTNFLLFNLNLYKLQFEICFDFSLSAVVFYQL